MGQALESGLTECGPVVTGVREAKGPVRHGRPKPTDYSSAPHCTWAAPSIRVAVPVHISGAAFPPPWTKMRRRATRPPPRHSIR
jgi:hypothetical protein